MLRPLVVLSFLLYALAPAVADAQDDSRAEAREHFTKGTELYDAGEYAAALGEFREGKEVLADPSFDYSIALCLWKLGDLEAAEESASSAVVGFREYGRPEPIALNEGHLSGFRRIQKATEIAEAMPKPSEPAVTETITVEEPPERGVPAQTWIGITATAVGLGLLGGWTAVELSLAGTIDDYEAAAAANDTRRWQTLRDDIDSKQSLARILLFSGAGVTAVGGVFLIWGLASNDNGESRAAVRLTPTGAAFTWKF